MSDTSAGSPAVEPSGSDRPTPATTPAEAPAASPASRSSHPQTSSPATAPTEDGQPERPSGAAGGQRSGAARRRRRRRSSGSGGSGPAANVASPPEGTPGEAASSATGAHDAAEPETAPGPAGGTAPSEVVPARARPRIGDTRPARTPIPPRPVTPVPVTMPVHHALEPLADETDETDGAEGAEGTPLPSSRSRRRSGRERRGRPVGRYLMCVHVRPHATQIAVLEGRTLVEHYVSRVADDTTQIDGNIYRGRVQNVLPGMEAAFVDIGTPKNAVLYRGDVRYDRDDVESPAGASPRIEQMLRPGQTILCQVTKNPIGAKGARLTQEVSLPGRFVVMVPNSTAFGISKRLDDNERRRLRRIVDDLRPDGHGLIVRTAAEGASHDELAHDVARLVGQWEAIAAEAARATAPGLLYREPDLAVRIVREEFNREYRGVVIDDPRLYDQVRDYVADVNPELLDRVELYDPEAEQLPLFERFHVHEQLHKALDRKVWLPSGGSLIIERTEALTVIDVNTGKNVGKSSLEETVFRNNLEAAEEIARQLRLRDIGGIIVIDFIDMEIRDNREKVAAALRAALARDKTRTQVFDISELGLVEMTRKRVSEGLVEALSTTCTVCGGRGIVLDETLL